LFLHHHGNPNVRAKTNNGPPKFLGRDSDDGEWTLVELNRLPYHRWVASKIAIPHTVADHHDRMRCRGLVFGRKKSATKDGPHTQTLEVVARDNRPPDPFRLTFTRQCTVQAHRLHVKHDQASKRLIPISVVPIVRVGEID